MSDSDLEETYYYSTLGSRLYEHTICSGCAGKGLEILLCCCHRKDYESQTVLAIEC